MSREPPPIEPRTDLASDPTGVAEEARRAARAAKHEEELAAVRRKVERAEAARRHRLHLWRNVAQVGVLGWLFILPALALVELGRAAGQALHVPALAPLGLVAGLLLGAYLVYRVVRRSLDDEASSSQDALGGGEAGGERATSEDESEGGEPS